MTGQLADVMPHVTAMAHVAAGDLVHVTEWIVGAAMLTTAIGDMQTAYLDASGRTLPNFVNLGSGKFLWPFNVLVQIASPSPLGEIGGLTLHPGLYQWTTGVTVSSAPTFSGSSTDSAFFPSFTLSPSSAHI